MKVEKLEMAEVEKQVLDTGLIYAINKLILHPVGLALSITTETDGSNPRLEIVRPVGLVGAWSFSPEAEEAARGKLATLLLTQPLPDGLHALLASLVEEPST